MGFVWTLLVGLAVGALAKLFMPGKDPGGIIITMLLGIAGSAVAGLIGRGTHLYEYNQAPGFVASIAGAMLLLLGYRLIAGRLHARQT